MRNRPSVDASPDAVSAIDAVLDRFGPGALRVAASAGVRLVHLRGSEAYRDRSRALRRLAAGVDDWPVPPAGLFVVEEHGIPALDLTERAAVNARSVSWPRLTRSRRASWAEPLRLGRRDPRRRPRRPPDSGQRIR